MFQIPYFLLFLLNKSHKVRKGASKVFYFHILIIAKFG
jgi:hypothetical protein